MNNVFQVSKLLKFYSKTYITTKFLKFRIFTIKKPFDVKSRVFKYLNYCGFKYNFI